MATATRALVVTKRSSGRRPGKPRSRRRSPFPRMPLLIVGTLVKSGLDVYDYTMSYPDPAKRTVGTGIRTALTRFTGFGASGSVWAWSEFKKAGLPLVLAVVGHQLANYLGINRRLTRYVPLISI